MQGNHLKEVYVDNCCTVRNKLQNVLGSNIRVYLDVFHAAQRVTRTIHKRHPFCRQVMKDIKMLFRDQRDKGEQRTLPTPNHSVLLDNIDFFIKKWKHAESNGWFIVNDKVFKQLAQLKVHASKGCLSGINPGCGTNRNENLHRNINPFFSRCKMGIPLALALLTILFHHHNLKVSPSSSLLPARALYRPKSRNIAVQEWCENEDQYQGFLEEDYCVQDEAAKYKQPGYVFGPLGNTIVLAVSNALGIPVIVFSSAHHYPIVYITPRVCRNPTPLYVGFNQAGAGHYDAVVFNDTASNGRQSPRLSPSPSMVKCSCGRKGKHYANEERCIPIKKKYTSVTKCPCLANDRACQEYCICNNCSNPKGSRPIPVQLPMKRKRQRHARQKEKLLKSSLFAYHQKEDISPGYRTQFEYLLVAEIVKYTCILLTEK